VVEAVSDERFEDPLDVALHDGGKQSNDAGEKRFEHGSDGD
jgi:hypothetical protein